MVFVINCNAPDCVNPKNRLSRMSNVFHSVVQYTVANADTASGVRLRVKYIAATPIPSDENAPTMLVSLSMLSVGRMTLASDVLLLPMPRLTFWPFAISSVPVGKTPSMVVNMATRLNNISPTAMTYARFTISPLPSCYAWGMAPIAR